MIAAKLIELIEIHARALSYDIACDLHSNPRTHSFYRIRFEDLEQRVFDITHHLGDWIGDRRSARVETEFAGWGAAQFDEQIPLSETIYGITVLKQHLRRYIEAHGLIEAAFPRVESDYVLPLHLQSLQELNTTVNRFFDEVVYQLARGYEAQERLASPAVPPRMVG